MAEAKRKVCCVNIDVAKNGFEARVSYEAKKSLSQKAGWIPSSYEEPEKYIAKTKKELFEQLDKVLD